jgi:hypothetical protein
MMDPREKKILFEVLDCPRRSVEEKSKVRAIPTQKYRTSTSNLVAHAQTDRR